MKIRLAAALPALVLTLLWVVPAQAHFLWLVRGPASGGGEAIHVYFGELAEPDDPDLLDRVAGARVWQVRPDGTRRELKLARKSDSLAADLPGDSAGSLFVLDHEYGVIERGGETFLLRYYAKTGPELGAEAWKKVDASKHLPLDLVAKADGERLRVTVSWQGKPLPGAQVVALGPGIEDFEGTSGEQGQVAIPLGKPGVYSIRARHIEQQAGESEGREYGSTRHYSTLALPVSEVAGGSSTDRRDERNAESRAFPVVPQMVTSFGAAILDDALYTYGGHTGGAHAYSKESQADTLRRLSLKNPKAWESLARGPGLQGLALVAHGGKLYRIGGFMAKNEPGEEHDLWSQAAVAAYDPSTNEWTDLSPLPEPRSSFDAAVLDGKIYVVGGWWMAGDRETQWHQSAHVLDLTEKTPQWRALPQPPFQRRALAVAAHQGKIYVIGGMQQEGGPTTRVDIYDPASRKWSEGPSLQGEPMDGFGAAAFATGGRLYASTYSGKLQRLAPDGKSWEVVEELQRARFFHRMLPLSDTQLITVGGASMEVGKFEQVDVLNVGSPSDATAGVSAPRMLFQARQARAVWEDFPGFTADIRINVDGDVQRGTLVVSSEGEVSLSGLELEPGSDIERSLRSLVSHRLGEAEFTEDVSFREEEVDHPLGRLIKLDYDTRMASTYRVKGDLICQVNRELEDGRFTISVLSVHRNREGKVLPEAYNVSFWNEDGTLRESTTVRNEWTRVGAFDLPTSHAAVTAGKDSYSNVRIELSNHRLAKAE